MALGGKLSQMAILLFISIIMMLSRLILIKKSFIILLKLRPLRPHSLMDCKFLNFLIVRLRSIFQMELKKLFSLMELLNVYLLMERKNQYLQMALYKELKRLELKPQSMQVDKKIFFSQMAHELENTQTEELKRQCQMELPRPQ